MQNSVLKFLSILFLTVSTSASSSFGQSLNTGLAHADSLFQQKRYIQSFEIYQTIFEKEQYTPAMLMKMAYIQEGLNQTAQSMYYLNLYYRVSQDEAALTKMAEVADKYRLEGYDRSDADAVWTLYQQYHLQITLGLAALVVFLLALILVQRLRFNKIPYLTWTFLFLFSTILMVHLHRGQGLSTGIISKTNTYLMDGPSGGASVVSIVRDGHLVKIKGQKDVWLKVQWGDREVYVKEANLLRVAL